MVASERIDDIVRRLIDGGQQTEALFESLLPEEWAAPVQGEGERWRVQDMLAHFASIERSMHQLIAGMLEGNPDPSAGFDLNRFNNSQVAKLQDATRADLLERFRQIRQATIQMVQEMADDDLDRPGIHPFLGKGTLECFVRWAYEHAAIHEDEIRQALRRR